MTRPRLMLVISAAGLGGAELTFHHLVEFLDVDRFEVCVVCPPWPAVAELADKRGMHYVPLPITGWPRPATVRALGRLVAGWRPDVMHSQLLSGDLHAALASRWARPARLVSTVQGLLYRWEFQEFPRRQAYWLIARLYRAVYGAFDALVACSWTLRDAMCEGPGIRVTRDKIGVIHNAVDFRKLRAAARASSARARGCRRRIVTVANLVPVKGHDLLLRALASLGDLDLECLLVGDGPRRGALERQARALGVAERVRFLGLRADVVDIVRSADLFVFPSLWDGFGIAVVEAMALEVPVVALARGGVPEIVEHGVSGLLVRTPEPGELAAAIRRGLVDHDLRARMVPAAIRRAEAFDARAMVEHYQRWYAGEPGLVPA